MIIVSDTSAITSLYQIGLLNLLSDLYTEIVISPGVQRELYEIDEQADILDSLKWIKVHAPINQKLIVRLMSDEELDLGESESIVLAIEQEADYLIIDEKLGRVIAREYGLKIVGILGVLVKAKQEGLILNIKDPIDRLQEIGFRLHPKLVERVLTDLGE